jgi:hypothetical protein
VIDAPVHRLAHLNAESVAACRRFSCQELTIKPGGSRCGDLGLEREVRPCGERQPAPTARIFIGTCLDDCARRGVARHFEVGELQMVRSSVDAFDDGIGGALELVV